MIGKGRGVQKAPCKILRDSVGMNTSDLAVDLRVKIQRGPNSGLYSFSRGLCGAEKSNMLTTRMCGGDQCRCQLSLFFVLLRLVKIYQN